MVFQARTESARVNMLERAGKLGLPYPKGENSAEDGADGEGGLC